jgi:hypothetical protein
MGAFCEDGIEAVFFSQNPDTKFLLVFLVDLADRVIFRSPSLKRRGWLKKNARKS